jgi:putative FmdB family regulatory protein
MPIYEYKCKKCGSEFEVFKKITDPDEKNCKFCNGPVNKLISLSSFQLQGSGWYVTDYAGKKPKAEESKKEDAPSETKKEVTSPATTEKN